MFRTIGVGITILLLLILVSVPAYAGSDRQKGKAKVMEKTFMKPSQEELKKKLTPLQSKVTQEEGTEQPFNNDIMPIKAWDLRGYRIRRTSVQLDR